MAVSDRDKEKMRRLAEDLKQAETSDPPTRQQRRLRTMWINTTRAEIGLPPLPVEEDRDEYPEEGIYYRGRAIGMARSRFSRR